MKLVDAKEGESYTVTEIATGDAELDAFLLTLGCYAGEQVTLLRRRRGVLIVLIKGAKYCIDTRLGGVITVE